MGASVRPIDTGDDDEFEAWKAQKAGKTAAPVAAPVASPVASRDTGDDAEFEAWKAKQATPAASTAEKVGAMIGQGATAGFAGKILGGLDALDKARGRYMRGEALGESFSDFGQNYAATRDRITGAEEAGLDEHPIAGRALEMASGVVTALPMAAGAAARGAAAVAKPLFSTGAKSAAVGAGYGALAGAGHATGDARDYADEMLSGASIGAALGAAAPVVGRGMQKATSGALDLIGRPTQTRPLISMGPVSIGQMLGVDDRAAQQLAERLTGRGVDLPGLMAQAKGLRTPPPGIARTPTPRQRGTPIAPGDRPLGIEIPVNRQAADNALRRITASAPARAPLAPAGDVSDMEIPLALRGSDVSPMEYMRPPGDGFDPMRTAGPIAQAALKEAEGRTLTKPMSVMDLAGDPGVRQARGLKTGYPEAETVLKEALGPRDEGAVQRVIDQGLTLTGLKTRKNGLQTVDDLIAQRAQHGRENFEPTFAAHPDPIDDPRLHEILQTPAGQQAAKRGSIIAANRGDRIGSIAEPQVPPAPEGIKPDDWANMLLLAQERGTPIPTVPGQTRLTPTLRQAHYVKLGFDDMLNSAPDPGSGGSGPNNAAAIRGLKNQWLGILDEKAQKYGADRKVFADESDLIRAGELGRKLFKIHPDEAAKAFRQMSDAERDVARRTGFDALADRVENGPADVERGVSKVRDQKRMRVLFPDDASFAQFKEGLAQEAQMHATGKTVFGGSNTADKLADLMDIAGVPLDAIASAAMGRPGKLASWAAKAHIKGNAGEVAAEQARLLSAGASGSSRELETALDRLLKSRGMANGNRPGSGSTARASRQAAPREVPEGETLLDRLLRHTDEATRNAGRTIPKALPGAARRSALVTTLRAGESPRR